MWKFSEMLIFLMETINLYFIYNVEKLFLDFWSQKLTFHLKMAMLRSARFKPSAVVDLND